MGSQGCSIARMVAERLGFPLLWRELIHRAAAESRAHTVALKAIDELGLLGLSLDDEECQAYQQSIRAIIMDIARQKDAVILGRGAQVVLKDHPSALHVRLIAPLDLRVKNLMRQYHISAQQARARLEASDRYRQEFYRRIFHVDWEDPTLYHLILNTGLIGAERACDLIVHAGTFILNVEAHKDV